MICFPYMIVKTQLVEPSLRVLTNVIVLCCAETCDLPFQGVLNGRIENSKACKCSPDGPCLVLREVGIDIWHCLLGNCWPP